jgi:GTPase SAR1 family protein
VLKVRADNLLESFRLPSTWQNSSWQIPSQPETDTTAYNLLSIGQRGAGKTVFLAGIYSELHQQAGNSGSLSLVCEDEDTQETLDKVLNYVAKTGDYLPPTLKISNFDFSLRQRSWWKSQTLCQFSWWDTPGESCQIYNPAFLTMLLNSQGCCLFIDAHALVKASENNDSKAVRNILTSVKAIAEILSYNQLTYPLAIILTKCDLFQADEESWQVLENTLAPVKIFLDSLDSYYQIFYSRIPIVTVNGVARLKASEAVKSLTWLVSTMRKIDTIRIAS